MSTEAGPFKVTYCLVSTRSPRSAAAPLLLPYPGVSAILVDAELAAVRRRPGGAPQHPPSTRGILRPV